MKLSTTYKKAYKKITPQGFKFSCSAVYECSNLINFNSPALELYTYYFQEKDCPKWLHAQLGIDLEEDQTEVNNMRALMLLLAYEIAKSEGK